MRTTILTIAISGLLATAAWAQVAPEQQESIPPPPAQADPQQPAADDPFEDADGDRDALRREAVPGTVDNRYDNQQDVAAGAANVQDNRWRYRYHNGRWWYWMPDNRWVYWGGSRWNAYVPGAARYYGYRYPYGDPGYRYDTGYRGYYYGGPGYYYNDWNRAYYGRPFYGRPYIGRGGRGIRIW